MKLLQAAIVFGLMLFGSVASADCKCGQCDCVFVPRRLIVVEIPQFQSSQQPPRMIVTTWRGLFGVVRQQVVVLH